MWNTCSAKNQMGNTIFLFAAFKRNLFKPAMLFKINCLFFIYLLLTLHTYAQNLVANSGFEEVNICTEYEQDCSPEAWNSTSARPLDYKGQQQKIAFKGKHFLPVTIDEKYNHHLRTFWQTKLRCTLVKNQLYRIRFYIACPVIPENISFYFSPKFIFTRENQELPLPPSVRFTASNFSPVKKSAWLEVNAEYRATGNEVYLVIGNFRLADSVVRQQFEEYAYFKSIYCIDELSVEAADSKLTCAEWKRQDAVQYANNYKHTPPADCDSSWSYWEKKPDPLTVPPPQPIPTQPIRPEPRFETFTIPDILFKFDSSNINPAFTGILDSIAAKIAAKGFRRILVNGYTDGEGTYKYNLNLSLRRASSITTYLEKIWQFDRRKMTFRGYGKANPIAPNNTEEGRQKNRRVELMVLW
jgi:outer membrane protein OmpA-like peptidoglycan-associated protein